VSQLPRFRPLAQAGRFAALGLPLFALHLVTVPPAQAGTAKEGEILAGRWCVSCHDIGRSEKPTASDTAPTFDSIARRKDFNRVHLEAWLGHPHPPMPNLSLTRSEIDSLVDYIESLQKPQ
jgi:mono/diheme cytochrome c family protein